MPIDWFGRSAFTLLVVFLGLISGCQSSEMVKPMALRPGDTIAFVAPAGELDKVRIERATGRLEAMGFNVVIPANLYRQTGYLAGTDQERADELMRAFLDPEVNAIFPGTGGYGTTRMLDLLDYDLIRKNPKVFIGFSDITGLHIALHEKSGLVTFHSPNPMWGLGSEGEWNPFARDYFWRALLADAYTTNEPYVIDADERVEYPITTVRGGKARGVIVGGNLSLVQAVTGTDYQLDTRGKILYLEDIGEAPYRVDRMLRQLKASGQLDEIAGAILGRFTRRRSEDTSDETTTMEEVLDEYFAPLGVPVIRDFPAGHVSDNATLPMGVVVELDADAQTVTVLERPIRLADERKVQTGTRSTREIARDSRTRRQIIRSQP
ncbi:S66 peptidase family protein [Mucisphaera calidilacus]|uniref:Putative murein peptide carboxypeptidase n=1 Tax=Mucisphaera calidilacus TaxID=2527982 RepID=A0A518BZF6_9BACT|nr:LD-carboxypeptidase [Mucisphaera calidilacus]QDU72350.1 putative murein peptide carboxypeptidase [Mucisphaera calidilacus]